MNPLHRPRKPTPTEYNGRVYASKMQAEYAHSLDLEMAAGLVAWWIPEVTIQLGADHRYRVDFVVARWPRDRQRGRKQSHRANLDTLHVECVDVKAVETREFARSARLWAKYGPMPLHVVKRREAYYVYPPGE